MSDTALVIMARYPQKGTVKTRLARSIGDETTVRLYQAFLIDLAHRFTGNEFSVHWAYTPTNNAEASRLYDELKKIMNHTGMAEHHVLGKNFYMNMSIPVAGCAHQAGTCRFGTDPATSVLDINCKAHELDNLYVVDTSFFPSIGAVNPALTAMANALRVADHMRQRLTT